jgi:hypothetical protein
VSILATGGSGGQAKQGIDNKRVIIVTTARNEGEDFIDIFSLAYVIWN